MESSNIHATRQNRQRAYLWYALCTAKMMSTDKIYRQA